MKVTLIARPLFALGLGAVLLAGFTACSHHSDVSVQNASTANNTGNATSANSGTLLIPAGTVFYGKLRQPISTKSSRDGDTFTVVHTNTFLHKNATLQGDIIDGHLENIHAAGPLHKPGMTIVFDDLRTADGTKLPIHVALVSMKAFKPQSHHLRTIGLMIGGAIAGHEVAKHTGKKHGGLIGAAGGYALSQTMKTNIVVPAGTVLEVKFTAPVTTATNAGS